MNVCHKKLINVGKPAKCNVSLLVDKCIKMNREIPNTINFCLFKFYFHPSL